MSTVVLIDYGSGNLRSAEKALARAAEGKGVDVVVSAEPEIVAGADRLVLPGVGAFAACMGLLHGKDGLIPAMTEAVKDRGVPFMGICVGMQLLGDRGLEFGVTPGLGWIAGDVRRLEPDSPELKVPHMGWNALENVTDHPLFKELEGRDVYFTHSFALYPDAAVDAAAWTTHGERFAAAVAKDNMAGVQFHPEKSQGIGIRMLGDFLQWRP